MISFRYHVVTLLAVFLALAVGIALGGGPLSEIGRSDASEAQASGDQIRTASQVTSFQDAFAGEVTPSALSGELRNRPVSVISLPGADQKVVQSLGTLIKQADGSVAGTYTLKPKLIDPENSSLVSALSAQVTETVKDTGVSSADPAYVRLGRLIGFTTSTRKNAGEAGDQDTENVRSSLEGSGLLSRTTGNGKRGSLVIVVLGDQTGEVGGTGKLVAQLATGIAGNADSVVVAGSTDSGEKGLLEDVRADDGFTGVASSMDSVQTLSGRAATILALAAGVDGKPGQYGAHGSDGALPGG